jgi:hypothetical protein
MPLNKRNTKYFFRGLYAGELQTVTLLKRGDDQQEGTVTAFKLFNCRRGQVQRSGEAISSEMFSDQRTTWHIPRTELDRVGVRYLNALDRIVDEHNRYWEPESQSTIQVKLWENWVTFDAVRIDPPNNLTTGSM